MFEFISQFFRPLFRAWLRPYRALGVFSALWTLVLALGIAVSTVCYTQLQQTVFKPLDFPNPEQIIAVARVTGMCRSCPVSAPLMRDVQALLPGIAGFTADSERISSAQLSAQNIQSALVTPNFFAAFNAPAKLGRLLQALDADTDAIVISDSFWRTHFKADPNIVGKTVRLGEAPKVIVGVASEAFERAARAAVYSASLFNDQKDGSNFLDLLGRVDANSSLTEISQKLKTALATAKARDPESYGASDYQLIPQELLKARTRWLRETLTPVLSIVIILAVLMAINASSLFAVTVLERISVLMTEIALGAHRARLIAGVAMQAINLTLSSAIVAAVLAPWLFELTRRYLVSGMQSLDTVSFNWGALGAVTLVFMVLNVIAGSLPAWLILRKAKLIQMERTQVNSTGTCFGKMALAAQLIAATAVVMLALLLLRTLTNVNQVDPGFDIKPIWTSKIILPNSAQEESTRPQMILRNEQFMSQALAAVRALPGVESAAFAGDIPLGQQAWSNGDLIVPGAKGADDNNPPYAQFRPISGDYAAAMGLKIVSGRLPQWRADSEISEGMVNQEYVDRFMPGIDPVGRVVADYNLKIVGVLQSVKQVGPTRPAEPDVYTPFAVMYFFNQGQLIIRNQKELSPAAAEALLTQVRAIVQHLDPRVPVFDPQTGNALLVRAANEITLLTRTVMSFAGLALLTTALGLFGLCAFSVSRRRREFGLRLALGAKPIALLTQVLRSNLKFSAVCALIGLALGYKLSDLIAASLFGVARTDGLSATFAVLTILVLSVLASLSPAWRATRVNPMLALRGE
jgi:putative ABC transport system permease protein